MYKAVTLCVSPIMKRNTPFADALPSLCCNVCPSLWSPTQTNLSPFSDSPFPCSAHHSPHRSCHGSSLSLSCPCGRSAGAVILPPSYGILEHRVPDFRSVVPRKVRLAACLLTPMPILLLAWVALASVPSQSSGFLAPLSILRSTQQQQQHGRLKVGATPCDTCWIRRCSTRDVLSVRR